jgi:hypothetical protein
MVLKQPNRIFQAQIHSFAYQHKVPYLNGLLQLLIIQLKLLIYRLSPLMSFMIQMYSFVILVQPDTLEITLQFNAKLYQIALILAVHRLQLIHHKILKVRKLYLQMLSVGL